YHRSYGVWHFVVMLNFEAVFACCAGDSSTRWFPHPTPDCTISSSRELARAPRCFLMNFGTAIVAPLTVKRLANSLGA
ncbi:hypothetical protein DFJ58DRAFT_793487, partial [Suillus subalutaceus]|uniref:uncharacterized protein n=1 Tax=Suillus subalutaceus TaxID=48586 RepID=UPI001B88497B